MRDEVRLLEKQQPDKRSQGSRGAVQGLFACALTEKIREARCKHRWLIGEFANNTNQKHCLSRAGRSLYPQQATWWEVRFIIAPVCEYCVLLSAKDPLVRIVDQFVLLPLNGVYVRLRIHDEEVSEEFFVLAICLYLLLLNDKIPKVLTNVPKQ